jgi:hypothetical protein
MACYRDSFTFFFIKLEHAHWKFCHHEPKIYVRHFVAVRAFQELKVAGCSRVAETHNTRIETIDRFTEDMKKIHLKTGKTFSAKYIHISRENR